jgi:hypothetical protein
MLRYIPPIPNFFRVFLMKGCWILSKPFFCISWDNHVIFCPCFCLYAVLHLLICICWTTLASLECNQLIMVYDFSLGCVLLWFGNEYNNGLLE